MANIYKMARAFGRAMGTRKGNGPAAKAINESEVAREANNARRGEKISDTAKDYKIGNDDDALDMYEGALQNRYNKKGYEKNLDAQLDRETDAALERDFEKAFDDAAEYHGYKKWREESKDMPLNDGFGGDLHDVNREDAVQRAREQMINDLKSGMSMEEFMDKWK